MFRSTFVPAFCTAAFLAAMPAAPVSAAGLAPHRAVYDLQLKDASERSGIAGMYGRMVYEFNGNACDGYTVSFRFVTQINTGEETRLTDQQTTTYEDLKNRSFRFLTRSFTDEKAAAPNANRRNVDAATRANRSLTSGCDPMMSAAAAA